MLKHCLEAYWYKRKLTAYKKKRKKKKERLVHEERREWWGTPKTLTHRGSERESERSQQWWHVSRRKERNPYLLSPFRNPKIKTISFPQNQNPKLRWERSKRSEVPFSRNIRFSHTMATDSSDQLNFNPTTTTEENPKQILDDDTTTTAITPTRSSRRRRRGRTNRWGLRSAFCNHCQFRSEVWRRFEENYSHCLYQGMLLIWIPDFQFSEEDPPCRAIQHFFATDRGEEA